LQHKKDTAKKSKKKNGKYGTGVVGRGLDPPNNNVNKKGRYNQQ